MKNKATAPHPAAPKKNVRARLMYGYYRGVSPAQSYFCVSGKPDVDGNGFVWDNPRVRPVYVLEAPAEAFDAMALQLALVMRKRKKVYHLNVEHGDYYASRQCDEDGCGYGLKAKIEHKKWCCIKEARQHLAAIGIQPAARVARSRRD